MDEKWGPTAIPSARTAASVDDRPHTPTAMRPVLLRGVLTALVVLFVGAVVLTSGLPPFGR